MVWRRSGDDLRDAIHLEAGEEGDWVSVRPAVPEGNRVCGGAASGVLVSRDEVFGGVAEAGSRLRSEVGGASTEEGGG
jgi:hypothetical protein